jgi:hypothetical protein
MDRMIKTYLYNSKLLEFNYLKSHFFYKYFEKIKIILIKKL